MALIVLSALDDTNGSFVIESFLDEETVVRVLVDPDIHQLTDVSTGEKIMGTARNAPVFRDMKFGKDVYVFELKIKPHSFRAFTGF
jgi:hypothetical protein